ncbi:hypothetical protein Rs2_09132 [Raphanus sativus]|nr:hypothetical protein Rs2_09132 [Raphanus sativus]
MTFYFNNLILFTYVPGPVSMSTNATSSTSTTPQSRQRGSDAEGRFPSSPSDICHSRRTALLRSVQMRTQPCGYASSSGTTGQAMLTVVKRGCVLSLWKKITEGKISLILKSLVRASLVKRWT